jgi:hypothetical protein
MKRDRTYTETKLLLGRWNARNSRRSYRMLGWGECEAFSAGEMLAYRMALAYYRQEQSVERMTEDLRGIAETITKGASDV